MSVGISFWNFYIARDCDFLEFINENCYRNVQGIEKKVLQRRISINAYLMKEIGQRKRFTVIRRREPQISFNRFLYSIIRY